MESRLDPILSRTREVGIDGDTSSRRTLGVRRPEDSQEGWVRIEMGWVHLRRVLDPSECRRGRSPVSSSSSDTSEWRRGLHSGRPTTVTSVVEGDSNETKVLLVVSVGHQKRCVSPVCKDTKLVWRVLVLTVWGRRYGRRGIGEGSSQSIVGDRSRGCEWVYNSRVVCGPCCDSWVVCTPTRSVFGILCEPRVRIS